MRLLMVSEDFPPALGGIQAYTVALAGCLARLCSDFLLVVPGKVGHREHDKKLGYRVVRIPPGKKGMPLTCLAPVLLLARSGRFDVAFHTKWSTAHSSLIGRALGSPRRVFVAAHGLELGDQPTPEYPLLGAPARLLRQRVFSGADGFFPVSTYTASLLRQAGVSADRLQVVSGGVDPETFRPLDATLARRHFGLSDRPVLLTVARLIERKGIDTVLEAMPSVLETHPGALYLVAGEGPDRPRLERIVAELGLSARVRFLGGVAAAELPRLYSACDLFVMPTRQVGQHVEGFGLVYLEAGACERPVIGARSGGAPDAIRDGETGLIVEPDDRAGLARAIRRVLGDPDIARRFGAAGRRLALTEGSWSTVAVRLMRAMQERS